MSERKFKVTVNGKTFIVYVEEIEAAAQASTPERRLTGATLQKTEVSPSMNIAAEQTARPVALPGVIKAPIPGVIISIKVEVGDEVKIGDPLLVLEAMKMENEIHSSLTGTVKRITVSKGDHVTKGDTLVVVE